MVKNNVKFEKTLIPNLGKTAKFAGFYFIDTFHEHGIELSREQWLVLKKLNDKDIIFSLPQGRNVNVNNI